MNDIEVLEEYLKSLEFMGDTMIKSSEIVKLIEYKEIKAIERLLNRIKDLEEINEAHKKENGELRKELEKQQSLIKEKIEELKPINFDTADDRDYIIKVLEELLKGE